MKNLSVVVVGVAALLLGEGRAFAQNLWFADVGVQDTKPQPYYDYIGGELVRPDFSSTKNVTFGGGVSGTLGSGGTRARIGFGYGVEGRTDKSFERFDSLVSADLVFRVWHFAIGPNINLGMQRRGTDTFGRELGNFVGLGAGNMLRATFGPQGRAFFQLRGLVWLPGASRLSGPDSISTFGTGFDQAHSRTTFEGRISGGYIMGGGDNATIIRVQISGREMQFYENDSESFFVRNNRSLTPFDTAHWSFSVGIGRTF